MMMISEWTGAETWIHSFLYARGMTTPPPTCRPALHGLPAATGLCAVVSLWAATGLRAATGLTAATGLCAANGLRAATGLTASTLQTGCPLTPATGRRHQAVAPLGCAQRPGWPPLTGLHADARHRDGRRRPAPYCRLGWYGQPFSKPTDHRSRVTYAYMILTHCLL